MKKMATVIGGVVLTALIAIGGVSAQQTKNAGSIRAGSDDRAGFAGTAKVSLDSAVGAALKAVPGKALEAELENDNGRLVYGVEIAQAGHQTADVKVDAGNGKILKISADRNDKEDQEAEDSDNGREEAGER